LVWIEKEDRKINAKSLLGVLSLGIAQGMTVTLIADGADENEAVNGLFDLVNTGFAEFE
jgi:phosphocarrier protein